MITKEYPCIFPNVYNQNNLDGVYTIRNNLARNLHCRFSVQGCHIQRAQLLTSLRKTSTFKGQGQVGNNESHISEAVHNTCG